MNGEWVERGGLWAFIPADGEQEKEATVDVSTLTGAVSYLRDTADALAGAIPTMFGGTQSAAGLARQVVNERIVSLVRAVANTHDLCDGEPDDTFCDCDELKAAIALCDALNLRGGFPSTTFTITTSVADAAIVRDLQEGDRGE